MCDSLTFVQTWCVFAQCSVAASESTDFVCLACLLPRVARDEANMAVCIEA